MFDHSTTERIENPYFTIKNKKEVKRLEIQQKLLRKFDLPWYEEVEQLYDELNVLDIGSNAGDFIMSRLGQSKKLCHLIGIEYDKQTVEVANEKYGVKDKILFYNGDAESDSITTLLENILKQQQIQSFNVINISMLLLHLKNPFQILSNLKRFLSEDGTLIVKDIDDGLNLAYPDEGEDFARAIKICSHNDASGFRFSGRQIFTMLKNAGYGQVELKKSGLSTVDMDYNERQAFFNVYFSFVLEYAKIQTQRYPENEVFSSDYIWLKSKYHELEKRFLERDFFFTLGFMIFYAKK